MVIRSSDVKTATAPGYPVVLWKDCAEAECGCRILVGIRLDTQESATVASNCDAPGHFKAMCDFNDLMAATLANPQDRDVVEVACEVLSAAFTNLEM